MTTNKVYSSGQYYQQTYLARQMDIIQSTNWMMNYFRIVKQIFPEIYKYRKKNILEIGAGFGGFVNILNRSGFKNVVAADMSKAIFPKSMKNKLILLDLESKKMIAEKSDLVFAFDVMEHVNDTEKAVKNLSEILMADGIFIFCTPYPFKKHLLDNFHTNMQYPNFYTNIFRQNGFKLLTMQDVSFIPFLWRIKLPTSLKRVVNCRLLISETFFVFQKTD